MKKIICMGDILYHSENFNKSSITWIYKMFLPIIKDALSSNVEITFDITNDIGEKFSQEYFYKLNGGRNLSRSYNTYKITDFNNAQIDYLKTFFNLFVIVFGMELYIPFCDLLTSFGCKVVDFAYNSYKLFDDICFAVYANDINMYNALLKYQVPQEKFYYYANYWKLFMEHNRMIQDSDLKDNSVLFIGQTLKDNSVEKDGIFLNVSNYTEKLRELSDKYSAIYYLPHPYMRRNRQVVYNYVNKSPYIELIKNRSTYGVLASDKIKKVVGISTSVLYEAKYFDKEVEYLYKPLFNIDVPFEEHSYVSIYEDCWNPKFWADLLESVCDVNKNVKNVNHFKGANNKIRNVRDIYWGYAQLDPIKRLPSIKDSIKNLYFEFMALVRK